MATVGATISRALLLILLSVEVAIAETSETNLDFRLPVLALHSWSPDSRFVPTALPKTEAEHITWLRPVRITFKAEHEAELELAGREGDHETKLEAELRRIAADGSHWQPFVRTAALAQGEFAASVSKISALEVATGVFRPFRHHDARGSIEFRVGYRDHVDARQDFSRAAIKLKFISPVGNRWVLNGEAGVNVSYPQTGTVRVAGDLRLYALRNSRHGLQLGGMLFCDGSVQAGMHFLRFGVGPAAVFIW